MSNPDLTPEQAQEWADFQKFRAQKAAEAEAAKPAQYYVHLASGPVVVLTQDELNDAGTHFDGVQIVNVYKVGA